ncbi:spore coat protein U domain-containing protein [Lysobacter sp. Root494]|uniref:Csu type fimbrial protein n=1 Tax=Lysobacter sp. Root494 TaxID=1736549 RepID=UPI0006FC7173|nr:spore coat protein U domain-containing protein [Lysobacter sp. Root494]KQY52686.1 hypothetical protein ASD14_08915 [Lysobacter sp. Root494]
MSRLIFPLLVVVVLLAWSATASAQTCTVASSSGISFGGNLSATPTGQIDVGGSIVLTCIGGGNGQPRRVCLSLGTDAPVPNPRRLVSGANTLNFQLYDSSGGAVIATSTSESTGMVMERAFTSGSPSGTPVNVSFPISGRLFAGQTAASGNYSLALAIATDAGNFTAGSCAPAGLIPQGSSFPVNAGVGADCTLDIPNVSFGTVTRLTSPINAITNATVTCTSGAPWTLAMNAGSTPGNTYASRRMGLGGGGPGTVQYQIYRDPGPANVWGNGTMGTVTRTGTGAGTPQSIPIYLQVPTQGPQAEGTYSDTVTATLTF